MVLAIDSERFRYMPRRSYEDTFFFGELQSKVRMEAGGQY